MTFKFSKAYVNNVSTVGGPYEKKGPLGKKFDKTYDDLYIEEDSWEKAEVKLLEESIDILLNKSKKKKEDIDLIIAGDLLNQISASCYGIEKFKIPFLGIYSACTTSTEGILLAACMIDSSRISNAIVSVSSHNMASEKQFRNILLQSIKTKVKVESATIGRICNMDQKDPNNMGAAMAIAAADTIYNHLKDTKRSVNYYDLIITGDLGKYGKKILIEYMKSEYGIDMGDNYNDSGTMIYDMDVQKETLAGGSGPACSPLVNYSHIIPLLEEKKLNKVLIVATGALFSPTFVYQKQPILSISHAVSLESVK